MDKLRWHVNFNGQSLVNPSGCGLTQVKRRKLALITDFDPCRDLMQLNAHRKRRHILPQA
ncbi:hypothetical protein N2605_23805 [Bradyrhizobium yuanmingense]|uniref:hypothetical protein n=1 Tax=Bradyrhizobium yuanmingense TaxID=108015 RepID=UPI0021A3A762|nr:hypothetical protein [Bradyrhizobium sp. CB1024]UWU82621.1 hypothetical protein N2605_23805 [Bradyrhizobium sp. CB1024]